VKSSDGPVVASVVADAVPVLLAYVDRDERYRFANAAYRAWIGSDEPIVGRTVREVLGEDAYAVVRPRMAVALAGEEVRWDAELRYASGITRWVDARYLPQRNEAGEVDGFVAAVLDVGERRRAEEALRGATVEAKLAADRLRVLAEASRAFADVQSDAQSVAETVAEHLMVGVGDSCTVLLLTPRRDELVPTAIRHRHADVAEAIGALLAASPVKVEGTLSGTVATSGEAVRIPVVDQERLLANALPGHREHVVRYPLYSLMCVPLRARGEVLGVVTTTRTTAGAPYTEADQALVQDVADRAALAIAHARAYEAERAAVQQLTKLERLARLLASAVTLEDVGQRMVHEGTEAVSAISAVLYVVQPDGSLVLSAHHGIPPELAAAVAHLGKDSDSPGALVVRTAQPLWIESFDQYRERWPATAAHSDAAGRHNAFAVLPLVSEGECFGVVSFGYAGVHVFTPAERAFLGMLAYHAAHCVFRARLLARAEEAAKRAEEASRLKGEFLATVSHELRTPLSAILGWSSMLASRANDPAAVTGGLAVIDRNARAQLRLVEDILDVSRIERGQLRLDTTVVELEPLVRDVLESLRPATAAKQIDVRLSPCDAPCRVLADPERLRQIVWNLVSNAVKFSDVGGRIDLTLEQAGARVSVVVRDEGRGIEPSFLPHVFEPFRQADGTSTRATGGLGLGLSVVKHLVELHGGVVTAESAGPGCGATFTVIFPVNPFTVALREARASLAPDRAPPSSSASLAASRPTPDLALRGRRVLVVEDEDDARELISVVLSSAGAVVSAAESADAALEELEHFAPDVVVSDIGMPRRDGYWLVGELHRIRADLPVIALTAFARREDVARAHAAGFAAHVAKPVEPATLIDAVVRARQAT